MGTVHKEVKGGISHARLIREVTILIQTSSNQPSLKDLVLGQTKINDL
jgi:hypothetical protein